MYELESRIDRLKEFDICYASVDHQTVIEDKVLSKINKGLQVVMNASAPCRFMEEIIPFLDRENTTLIAESSSFVLDVPQGFIFDDFYAKYGGKLLFFKSFEKDDENGNKTPNEDFPLGFGYFGACSLSTLLPILIIGGASKVVLFGADGGKRDTDDIYFYNCSNGGLLSIVIDTLWFNKTFAGILDRTYKTWDLERIGIVNCSPNSFYGVIPKLSYDETFKFML